MPKPDFTGKWKFIPGKSVLQTPAPDATLFVIDHHDPVFRMSRTHTVGDSTDTFSIDLTTDGKEVILDRGTVRLIARAYWQGDILVFDTDLVSEGEKSTNVVKYHLDRKKRCITARERFRSKNLSYDNLWTLERS